MNNSIASEWMLLFGEDDQTKQIYDMRLYYERSLLPNTTVGEQSFMHSFWIRLRDNYNQDRSSAFSLNDRSKGFLWFANFILMIAFSPTYKRPDIGNIFLLDEPGAYLHSRAQEQLLDILVRLSERSPIVYATHLPQLLDPKKVNPKTGRVAYRDDWKIKLDKYGQVPATAKLGHMTALHEALQLSISAFIHPQPVHPFVITEGISDFYAFSMVKEFTQIFDGLDFYLIPGSGVTNLDTLISLAIAWSDPYVVIFDKDTEANNAIKKYKNVFGDEQEKYWIQLENVKSDKNVAIERLFSDTDQKRLKDLTNVDVKKAISVLFFIDESDKKTYWDGIDSDSIQNFDRLRKKLEAILKPTP